MARLETVLDPSLPTSLVELSSLVHFLANELSSLSPLDEVVNTIERAEDGDMFCMELAGLLRELCNLGTFLRLFIVFAVLSFPHMSVITF